MSDAGGTWPWAVGTSLGGRYLLDALIRGDARASLYRATDNQERRIVQVEALNDLGLDLRGSGRFEQALGTLRRLDHPNITTILDQGLHQKRRFVVWDWLDGESLHVRVGQTALAVDASLAIVRQLLAALASVHAVSLVHAQLTPHAVFLQRLRHGLERVKLTQFRFSSAGPVQDPEVSAYQAPELALGEAATARSDVYAAGVMLRELLNGELFRQKAADALAPVLESRPSSAPVELEPAMRALIERATAATASQRFADAAELLCALIDAMPRAPSVIETQEPDADAPSTPLPTLPVPVLAADAPPSEPAAIVPSLAPVERSANATPAASRRRVSRQLLAASAGSVVVGLLGLYAVSSSERPTAEPTAALARPQQTQLPTVVASRPPPVHTSPTQVSVAPDHAPEAPSTAAANSAAALAPRTKPGAPRPRNPWLEAVPDGLQGVPAYVANGGQGDEPMVRTLHEYSRINTRDPRGYLLLGRLYCNRLWRADCVAAWAHALRRDPSVRGAPELLPQLIQLVMHGKDATSAGNLIVEAYGPEALAGIEDAMAPLKNTEAATRLRELYSRILAEPPG